MGLPILKRFCVCMPLEAGGYITSTLSFLCCLANLSVGSWLLPYHKQQQNEDNVILMSMVMFSTLSAISNVAVLLGLVLKRPNYLQLSLLSNSVFILCIFLVAVVSCLFSPTLQPYLQSAGNIVLAVILLAAGAVYSLYYLTVVNSLYTKMKMMGSAIPV